MIFLKNICKGFPGIFYSIVHRVCSQFTRALKPLATRGFHLYTDLFKKNSCRIEIHFQSRENKIFRLKGGLRLKEKFGLFQINPFFYHASPVIFFNSTIKN